MTWVEGRSSAGPSGSVGWRSGLVTSWADDSYITVKVEELAVHVPASVCEDAGGCPSGLQQPHVFRTAASCSVFKILAFSPCSALMNSQEAGRCSCQLCSIPGRRSPHPTPDKTLLTLKGISQYIKGAVAHLDGAFI